MAATREYDGVCVRVIDGDTLVLRLTHTFTQEVDFGFYVKDSVSLTKTAEVSFRLFGINAPETHGPTKARGEAAKSALEELVTGVPLRVVSYKPDKYGRGLGDLYAKGPNGVEVHVNHSLIATGHAIPWNGTGLKPV